jgi:hypothetical protein
MNSAECLGIVGSGLTFSGGVVLSLEAFFLKRRIKAEAGANRLLRIMKSHGSENVITDEKTGKPLNTEKALRMWFAERSLKYSWIGFSLLAFGFLFDFVSRLVA